MHARIGLPIVICEQWVQICGALQILNSAQLPACSRQGLEEMGLQGENVTFGRENPLGIIGMQRIVFVEQEIQILCLISS